MRTFNQTRKILRLLLVAMLCTTVIPFRSVADDKEASNPPAKPVSAKPDSPAPLTARERWMLDRMEQLEKRVAELESKSNSPVTPATEISLPQLLVIVQVFVTESQSVNALRQHLFQRVLDPLRLPVIREAARYAPQQADLAIGLA